MPEYIFANPAVVARSFVYYKMYQRGDTFWYQRETVIVQPNGHPDFVGMTYFNWFGPYKDEVACREAIKQAQVRDSVQS